jgi:hypothetical protein
VKSLGSANRQRQLPGWELTRQLTLPVHQGEVMEPNRNQEDALAPPSADSSQAEQIAAWEQIETGRYMPRRVRGSCHGRELG